MYYGRRGDGQLIQPSEEYYQRADQHNEIVEKLKEKLKEDKEGLELLDQLFWTSAGVEAAAVDQHYCEGFSFGGINGFRDSRYAMRYKKSSPFWRAFLLHFT